MAREIESAIKSEVILIRVTPAEKAAITANADRRATSVSAHLRESAIKSK